MIIRPYEFFIAIRFLLKGKVQTILIIFGIATGVAVQFFLSSLISGLQISLIERTVGTQAHILILPEDTTAKSLSINFNNPDQIYEYKSNEIKENSEILSWKQYIEYFSKDPEIKALTPVAQGMGFLEKGQSINSVLIKGVDLNGDKIIYKLDKNLINGSLDIAGNQALIGNNLSSRLKLNLNDNFYLRNSTGVLDFFTVRGIFDLGSENANNLVLLNLDRARNFLSIQGISSIEMQINDIFKSSELSDEYRSEFNRIKIESWQEKNRELLTALRSQSSSSDIIQFFVLFSISLGIASVLGIASIQKSRQLGILKAMGVDDKGAAFIFLIQGLLLGLMGSLSGIIIGYGLGQLFMKFAGNLGFSLDLGILKVISPVILALFSSGVASLIPARSASKLSPIEVIRNG